MFQVFGTVAKVGMIIEIAMKIIPETRYHLPLITSITDTFVPTAMQCQ